MFKICFILAWVISGIVAGFVFSITLLCIFLLCALLDYWFRMRIKERSGALLPLDKRIEDKLELIKKIETTMAKVKASIEDSESRGKNPKKFKRANKCLGVNIERLNNEVKILEKQARETVDVK